MLVNAFTGGGAERAATMLANLLADHGLQVVLVAARSGGADLVRSDVRVESLGKQPGSGLAGLPGNVARFRKLCRSLQPDIVHAHCELPELLAVTAPSTTRLCVTEHSRSPWPRHRPVGALVRRELVRRQSTWAVPQRSVRVWRVDQEAVVVPNPLLEIARRWRPARVPEAPLHVVCVSRLVDWKRIDWVIRAVSAVGARLTVIGSGEDERRLRTVAEGVAADVTFLGQVHDPWGIASSADVYVSASGDPECDPLSLAEALLHEMPVLVSRTAAHMGQGLTDRNLFRTSVELEDRLREVVEGRLRLPTLIDAEAAARLRETRTPAAVLEAQLHAYGLA